MTLQEFQFLKLIHKLTNHTEKEFYFTKEDLTLRLYDNYHHVLSCGKLSFEVEGIIYSLAKNQYIVHLPAKGTDDNLYRLTHKGIHYFQSSASQLLAFLFKSVLVPIVVAFITALLVSLYA